MKSVTFNRNKLYKEVWEIPRTQLAERYGLSHHQITRACKKLHIPVPRTGHWSKVRNRIPVKPKPLPESDIEEYTISTLQLPEADISDMLPKNYQGIKVKKHLRKPHQLIKATLDYYKDDHWPDSYGRYRPHGHGVLGVFVTPKILSRALRILDTLIREFERHGYEIGTGSEGKPSTTIIKIGEEKIFMTIQEQGKYNRTKLEKKSTYSWKEYEYNYYTTGRLRLKFNTRYFHSSKSFGDRNKKPLEDQLDKVFRHIFVLSEQEKQRRLAWEEHQSRLREEQKINEQRAREYRAELKRREELEELSKLFVKSHHLTTFIDEVERQANTKTLNNDELEKIKNWILWAREHANRINPVAETIKNLLAPPKKTDTTERRFFSF